MRANSFSDLYENNDWPNRTDHRFISHLVSVVLVDPTRRSPLQVARMRWPLPALTRMTSSLRIRSTGTTFRHRPLHSRTGSIGVPAAHVSRGSEPWTGPWSHGGLVNRKALLLEHPATMQHNISDDRRMLKSINRATFVTERSQQC